jgi:hypothetical protein
MESNCKDSQNGSRREGERITFPEYLGKYLEYKKKQPIRCQ